MILTITNDYLIRSKLGYCTNLFTFLCFITKYIFHFSSSYLSSQGYFKSVKHFFRGIIGEYSLCKINCLSIFKCLPVRSLCFVTLYMQKRYSARRQRRSWQSLMSIAAIRIFTRKHLPNYIYHHLSLGTYLLLPYTTV